ncbi:hypothetical protein SARC_09322 [Sphaeroforma arctica JP610]|uniref:Cytochrome b561 domain-containing protein n=1 Tax=Sphaeroforma arctica JP610 TaxID=667725 RepID=A0A0L0FN83_9EUKA|nr:hypothetical protein SARC_09322 [Sphaeroforma arctica JP610]KNC78237.1 hypothetical protein SARC_09322 [Sphaeroforma arctica JP610]|eukprot:XP_014152139.1 hypothetical protein SARC_09322 [Sphaeroforma arctica JP610]
MIAQILTLLQLCITLTSAQIVNRVFLDNGGPLFEYAINTTHIVATATLFQNAGWFGVGFGPGVMPESTVVIGQQANGNEAIQWDLDGRSADTVVQSASNEVIDGSFVVNDGNVVLSFTLPLQYGNQILAPDANNILVWAWGTSESLAYHGANRAGQQIMLSTAQVADVGITPTNRIFLDNDGPLFEYSINSTHLVATATLSQNAGWFGVGFGPGTMPGSTVIIGQQANGNEAVLWDLNGRSADTVVQSTNNEVIDGSFMVDIGSSILSFTLPLEYGAQTLTPDTSIILVWAWGTSDTLNYHGTNRAGQAIVLSSIQVAEIGAPTPVNRIFLDNNGPLFEYTINNTHLKGTATLQQDAGWLALGLGPGTMAGSTAVIGQRSSGGTAVMYDLNGYTPATVSQSAENTVTDGSFTSIGGTAVLRFTIPLEFGNNTVVQEDNNILVWAWGAIDNLAYHGTNRAGQQVLLSSAQAADVGQNPDDPMAIGNPECASSDPNFDFEVSLSDAITFSWFVDSMAQTLVARASISDTVGWFSIGFGQSPGLMVVSNAVIGQISDQSVVTYDLTDRDSSGITPQAVNMASNMSITQTNGATILTFTVLSSFALGLDQSDDTNIIWAWGENDLGYHGTNRGSAALNLVTCNGLNNTFTRNIAAQYAHGILMALAWMLLVPAAILSSIWRSKFDGTKWLMIHICFNSFGLILATVGFGLAFLLVAPGNHISASHHIIGLVVMIFMWLQPLNAAIRPHPPSIGHSRSAFRWVWEIVHKLFGASILLVAFYNIWLGLEITNAANVLVVENYTWAGVLALIFLITIVYFKYIHADNGDEAKAKWMESQDFNDPSMKLKEAEKMQTSTVQHRP